MMAPDWNCKPEWYVQDNYLEPLQLCRVYYYSDNELDDALFDGESTAKLHTVCLAQQSDHRARSLRLEHDRG